MAVSVSQPVKPLQLGSLTLPNNIIYSPLAGCSDYPFRKMVRQYHSGLIYCEMVKTNALVQVDRGSCHLLDFDGEMNPIGAQLCGSDPTLAEGAARIVEDLGFATIDLNCGCPVDKVTKDGSGSAMLKTPQLIGEILTKMIAAVLIPVTVKIRIGWDEQSINAEEVVRIAEEAGAVAIYVHGRTQKQGYRGSANWDVIKACKGVAKKIKVIGNGDVFDAGSALRMFAHTGCDGVLVSRGTFGQPWLAQDICDLAAGKPVRKRSLEDVHLALRDHFQYILSYCNDRQAILDLRRVGCWYSKKIPGMAEFRRVITQTHSVKEAWQQIEMLGREKNE